jgi:hypothetical protein
MHRFVWDLREPDPQTDSQDLPISAIPHDTPRVPQGPLVLPGRYTVRLDADGHTMERNLAVAMDPRVSISSSALEQQYLLSAQLASLMDRSFADAAKAGEKARTPFDALNGAAASLLDTIDGADAPPTAQAVAAVAALSARLAELEAKR